MGRVAKFFQTCFSGCQVDCESVEQEAEMEMAPAELVKKLKRPPIFPKKQRNENEPRHATHQQSGESRPHSPFELRLQRIGQRMEDEVSNKGKAHEVKNPRPQRTRSDGEEKVHSMESLWSSYHEECIADEFSDRDLSKNRRAYRKMAYYHSIDSSEPEICTRLVEEELILSTTNKPWLFSSGSCASVASIRDLTQTQYLFYEDEEDVIMEFFPSLRVIQQAS